MADIETAVIAGVGPGLGAALARRCAKDGMRVAVSSRDGGRLDSIAKESAAATGAMVRAYAADSTDQAAVGRLFERVASELGEPSLVVYNAGAFAPGSVLEIDPAEFERCWRVGCYGGFLVGQAAARRMAARGGGTILFTGATASLRGGARFLNLAVGKFGLRALAQSMARELGPKGVHVAHVIVDGQIDSERYAALRAERGPDALLHPDAIAESYWQLHLQPRSAWTQELDLRPWTEKF